ncbi:hypothetical protein F0562_029653 [Nyssa sinensis]|uniref:CCHC-type domain-containing protein n=1 Tax=Nyssa sinensis TaxID=561372 RepID=A0A5J5B7J2_9ASTE|nr:hypothetical protein F0562_029653 [Nyssa sinensis]
MEPYVVSNIQLIDTAEKIWMSLHRNTIYLIFMSFLNPLSTDLEVQHRQHEEFQGALFLSSLNSEYSVFKDQILASEKLPTVANAYSLLRRASLTRGTTFLSKETYALVSSIGSCDSGQRFHQGGGRGGDGQGSGRGGDGQGSSRGGHGGWIGRGTHSEWKCTYCGATGHTEDYCWDK